jgi:hypothetical protein
MTDWERVQATMLELERLGESNPDVLSTIAAILDTDIEGLHETLNAEVQRVMRLIDVHYAGHAVRTPRNYAAIGFLQGITFACAYDRVKQDG